jgi:hypothetical protein
MVISRMMLADTEFATFSLDDGLLSNSDRLYIPPVLELRTQVMHANHDYNIFGHLGMDKTDELTSRSFFSPNMQQDVRHYVRSCEQCQRNKPSNRRPGGLLQPIPIPQKRWEQITMDLIVGLPKTARGNSCIAMFVDRLSKEIKIAPISGDTTAPAIARVYFDNVFIRAYHGLSFPIAILGSLPTSGVHFSAYLVLTSPSLPPSTQKPTVKPSGSTR